MYRKSDILYTCLPLFHGNALFLTVTRGNAPGREGGARAGNSRRAGSGTRSRKYNVTAFNTIGAMIPILMKQPEKSNDRDNKVRFTLSAACPADEWQKFEKRFGITIYEGYGAVDGGGKSIMNLGNAPVGSIGKPSPNSEIPSGRQRHERRARRHARASSSSSRRDPEKSVEYFKNEKAASDKVGTDGYYTGDLVRRDSKGYLYFVGRNAEFMRIKGENVSAYEVEHTIQKHPSVLEAAVYAVPSELAEDEIMASVSLVDGHTLNEADLIEFLREDLPKFAVPRYIRIVKEFPKTETQRIIKKELEKLGIVPGTFDSEKQAHVCVSTLSN